MSEESPPDAEGGAEPPARPEIEALAAENEELRGRIDELEAALAEIKSGFVGGPPEQGYGEEAGLGADANDDEDAAILLPAGGTNYKVQGKKPDAGGVGVLGQATAGSGSGIGVRGTTSGDANPAAGVHGQADKANAIGVSAENLADKSNAWSFEVTAGMFAETDRRNESALFAVNNYTGSGGSTIGVLGRSKSSQGAGVYGVNSNGGPAVEANGFLMVSDVGASVYHSSSQSFKNQSQREVQFDTVVDDDRSEWKNSSQPHEFDIKTPGTYLVDSTLEWDSPPGGTTLYHEIWVNDNRRGQTQVEVAQNDTQTTSVSKVLHGLSGTDSITIQVYQASGGPLSLRGGRPQSYATFTRMG